MYVVYDSLSAKYYTNDGWSAVSKLALKLTKPRADELVESMSMQVARGWIVGKFETLPYENIVNGLK